MALKILLTNDDGIEAQGLKLLYEKAKRYGDVYVVAPKNNQSAKSHSIVISHGFEVMKSNLYPNAYSVDSTPADCVRYAYYGLGLDFDIVFSGINNGFNLGDDIAYSGTVSAAIEARMMNKKAIAFSCPFYSFDGISYFEKTLDYIFENLIDIAPLLNVNFPVDPKGIKITKQGYLHYNTYFEEKDGLVYQMGKPDYSKEAGKPLSDVACVFENYVSITPLTAEKTDIEILNKILNK